MPISRTNASLEKVMVLLPFCSIISGCLIFVRRRVNSRKIRSTVISKQTAAKMMILQFQQKIVTGNLQ